MRSGLIGARIQFHISDPWDLATDNSELFSGEIVKTADGTPDKPTTLYIKLDKPIISGKIQRDEFIARIRHEGKTAAGLLLGETVAFNFMNVEPAEDTSARIWFIAGMQLVHINS